MKGKVFESSMDVYQDQANVLFDFYLNAAQKIIDQEDDFDNQCSELDNEIATIEASKENVNRDYGIGGALVVLGIILAATVHPAVGVLILAGLGYAGKTYMFANNVQKEIDEVEERKQTLLEEKSKIFRDYKVNKIGVVYVPVAKKVPFGDKSVVVDLTGSTPQTAVSLQIANNPQALVNTLKDLERLTTEAPIVENADKVENIETSDYSSSIHDVKFYDYFGTMDRTLRTGSYYLSDVTTKEIRVPFVQPDGEMMNYLNLYATTEKESAPIINVFDENSYNKEMEEFKQINDFHAQFAQENANFEDVLKHLINNIGIAVQTVATLKVASNNKLIDSSNQLLFTILKNSYNHYSPLLEHEEIEKMRNTNFNYSDTVENYRPFQLKASSRVKYDALTGNWVAEDGTTTTMPFGISQIQEEIVAPIVQNLLEESRMERLRIYNDIKNQKINYLNQWHQDTEDFYGRNRTSSDDLVNIMRSNMTKFLASKATIESIASIKDTMHRQMIAGEKTEQIGIENKDVDGENLASFELQSQQFQQSQDEFNEYMERLKDDIDERAKNFEFIEYYDASLRDSMAKNLISAGDNQDQLDSRRRPLASINPLYAQISVLPPSPNVDDLVNEQLSLNVARYAATTLQEINDDKPTVEDVSVEGSEAEGTSTEEVVAENLMPEESLDEKQPTDEQEPLEDEEPNESNE